MTIVIILNDIHLRKKNYYYLLKNYDFVTLEKAEMKYEGVWFSICHSIVCLTSINLSFV